MRTSKKEAIRAAIEIREPSATSEDGDAGFTRQDVKREATAIVQAFLNDIQALSETAGGPGAKPQALMFAFRLIDELPRKISRFLCPVVSRRSPS